MLLFVWYTVADMNFKVFVETNTYEPIIMLMPPAWWRHQNKEILFIWMLIASVYLINFYLLEFLGFCRTNHVIYEPVITRILIVYWGLCLNVDCLYLFHKLLQTWNSKFLWKQYHMSLHWGWCLLRHDVIKIGKFVFVWTLIVSS